MLNSIRIYNGDNDRFGAEQEELQQLITENGYTLDDRNPDIIAVLGGDGSYLRAMRDLGYPETPVFGVNVGNLGYFQEITLRGVSAFLRDVDNGRYQIDQRPLLSLVDKDDSERAWAVNEIYVARAGSQAMKASLSIDKGEYSQFMGDGLIVATAQGSTAYASAAGGPIVEQDVPAMVVVPSNAHDTVMYESLRAPMVVSDERTIAIFGLEIAKRKLKVEVDGEHVRHDSQSPIVIKKSKRTLSVLRSLDFDLMQHLATKLVRRG